MYQPRPVGVQGVIQALIVKSPPPLAPQEQPSPKMEGVRGVLLKEAVSSVRWKKKENVLITYVPVITPRNRMQNVALITVLSVIKIALPLMLFVLLRIVPVITPRHIMQNIAILTMLSVIKIVLPLSHSVLWVMAHVSVWRNRGRFCRWTLKGWVLPSLFLCPPKNFRLWGKDTGAEITSKKTL